jgi:RNA recognition motif-containing protein
MTIFYFIWKKHFSGCITEQDEDKNDVKPEKFCLEIEGLEETFVKEEELSRFFASFGPVYEVSLVRRHKNKLQYFEELGELE